MNYVVAVMDESTLRTYKNLEEVPKSAKMTFVSAKGLAENMSVESMDKVRSQILGEDVGKSDTPELAAERLWHVFGIGADAVTEWTTGYSKSLDAMGNVKTLDHSKLELIKLTWVPGKDWMIDIFVKKLYKQARAMLEVMVEDGRGIWTSDQLLELLKANKERIGTSQRMESIWGFYRSKMFAQKILRRVSYLEFASKPEFEKVMLLNKEVLDQQNFLPTPGGIDQSE